VKIELKTGLLKIDNNERLRSLVGFGSRINKKRGFLFVSKVLGKHIPAKPTLMKKTFKDLATTLPQDKSTKTLFVGFAETATALGQGVFEAYGSKSSAYIHSTRYQTNEEVFFSFQEEHCHAPSHILYKPRDEKVQDIVENAERVILVDDEVSTGKTANNIVQELKKKMPNVKEFYLLTILNWVDEEFEDIEFLYLYKGNFKFEPKGMEEDNKIDIVSIPEQEKDLSLIIPYNFGRYGVTLNPSNISLKEVKKNIIGNRILVLGTSEFMFQPSAMALKLEKEGFNVCFQATTRSPANIDKHIKSALTFKDNYFENIDNFLYNVADKEYDTIIICYETTKIPKEFTLPEQLFEQAHVVECFFSKDDEGKVQYTIKKSKGIHTT